MQRGTAPPGPPGLSSLRSWASPAFAPDPIESLLSSPNLSASDVLLFTLEHVFGWGDVPRSHSDRKEALDFVTQWLGRDPPGDQVTAAAESGRAAIFFNGRVLPPPKTRVRLPSLARLSTQRIAMEVFPSFCDELDNRFNANDMTYFTDTLRGEIASVLSEREVPPYLLEPIIEEIFIFGIVYFLCVDIRSMTEYLPAISELLLPIGDDESDYDYDEDYFDDNDEILSEIVGAVPNYGRGVLAKVGLVTHAVCKSYMTNEGGGICHTTAISNLFHHKQEKWLLPEHPFARSVALAQISSLLHAMVVSDEDPSFYDYFMTEIFLPWLGRTPGPDKPMYTYLRLATKQQMSTQPLDDVPPFSTNAVVEECIDAYYANEVLYPNLFNGGWTWGPKAVGVKRLRLNGNYSEDEILYAAFVSSDATFVDLEHCWNLDEECLGLILHHLTEVKVMLLKGTSIDETSEVIRTANVGRKQPIDFVFSDACKCCGERKGTVKELQLSLKDLQLLRR